MRKRCSDLVARFYAGQNGPNELFGIAAENS
jgi:hypothetical protein